MSNLKFKCQKCGCDRLEEVMDGVTLTTNINSVYEGGDTDYGEDYSNGGSIDRFQCVNCGYELRWDDDMVVSSTEELYDWLKKHDMIEEDTEELTEEQRRDEKRGTYPEKWDDAN